MRNVRERCGSYVKNNTSVYLLKEGTWKLTMRILRDFHPSSTRGGLMMLNMCRLLVVRVWRMVGGIGGMLHDFSMKVPSQQTCKITFSGMHLSQLDRLVFI